MNYALDGEDAPYRCPACGLVFLPARWVICDYDLAWDALVLRPWALCPDCGADGIELKEKKEED